MRKGRIHQASPPWIDAGFDETGKRSIAAAALTGSSPGIHSIVPPAGGSRRGRPAAGREGEIMPTVRFTANIQRHVACPTRVVEGTTLREVLDGYFRENARARGYVLDEQGRLRRHMALFIDGRQIRDRVQLSDDVPPGGVVDVVQALSGG
jgi:hypothetical protein